jgi:hypothetical protein
VAGVASGWAPLFFLEKLQAAAVDLYDDCDPWTWAGRRRTRHNGRPGVPATREAGELHDRERPKSERREAIVAVVQCLARFSQVDEHLRIRHPRKRKEGIPIATDSEDDSLVKYTGLSLHRVKEAIADLLSMGWIGAKPEKNAAGDRNRPFTRWLTHRLIKTLRCWGAFKAILKKKGLTIPKEPPGGAAGAAALVLRRAAAQVRRAAAAAGLGSRRQV